MPQSYILPDFASKYNNTALGKNVFVFDPSMDMNEVQSVIDTIFGLQSPRSGEFSHNRFAIMLRPGIYNLDVRVVYYMQILGLGKSPEDVIIKGAVRSNTTHGNSVLTNFWRAAENITVIPEDDSVMIWGVSQAAPLRRVHIKGNLRLFDRGYASGGFLADAIVDGTIFSGPQQQWFTRNSIIGGWVGGVWNMMFMGVPGAPEQNWPEGPYTIIGKTPVIREKPWLSHDKKGFKVNIPEMRYNTAGPGWIENKKPERSLPLKKFHIAREGEDDASSINAALAKGKNILITPGRYLLDRSLVVKHANTIIMGTGLATLIPEKGNAAIEISDVDGVIVCGITIDAGPDFSDVLLRVGGPGSELSHEKSPASLYDIFFRVGGPAEGSAKTCLEINSNDVCVDHVWLWRADHGNGVGWDKNRGAHGLVVNGDNVTIYGLFNEHFQEYQTLWNGNNGRVFFYQSEMPYDPPTAESWTHNGTNGYASYKVSDHVTSHEAWGLGIYNVFYNAPVVVDNAIETPPSVEDSIHHKLIYWLNGNKESVVKSIINGKGAGVSATSRKSVMK